MMAGYRVGVLYPADSMADRFLATRRHYRALATPGNSSSSGLVLNGNDQAARFRSPRAARILQSDHLL